MPKSREENTPEIYFTPKALARRWNVTLHTLEQWRWKGHGPRFFKVGSAIRYPKGEIERFEMKGTCTPKLDVMDKRFLCIELESLPLREQEEITMSP